MSTGSQTTPEPHMLIQPKTTWLESIILSAKISLAQLMSNTMLSYLHYKHGFPNPDQVVSFPSHPHLRNRIFFAPNGNTLEPPPLFLDIHGGGFILLNPSLDDMVNAHIAKELGCLVISLDYSKAPGAKFPTATNQMIDTILDILNDESLNFDRSRVVLGGHSAGGNLTISCAQSPRLSGKLAGVIPWYPATDMSDDAAPKLLLRPYDFVGEADPLFSQIPAIRYAYAEPGQDLRDPRLSTLFADRSTLPEHIMIVGAENDMLAHEAWRQARRLAGLSDSVNWEDDQEAKYGFEKDGIKFLLIRGAKHGFTHFQGLTGAAEEKRKRQEVECWQQVRVWLESGPFKTNRNI